MAYEVSESALVARINRALASEGRKLRRTRGERMRLDVGDYWIQDVARNLVVEKFCDLEQLAERYNALHPGEQLVAAGGAR